VAGNDRALPTGTDDLQAALDQGVLRVTLNRPGSHNALSLAMVEGLARVLALAADDDEVRVVALTGTGDSFCAGGDVKNMARGESIFGPRDRPDLRSERQKAAQRATSVRLWDFPKPTVAVLNGSAVGAGLALALACDLRYATASAVLRTGFVRAGLAGDFGCTWLLTQLLGPARAKELMYFSPTLPATRAAELGLVTEFFPDESFAEEAERRVRTLSEGPPLALHTIKGHVTRALSEDLAECADAEATWHVRLVDTDEHRAAVAAVARGRAAASTPRDDETGPAPGRD
jgi:2-(1,2-epoxy-1,2-dihydrophenyl)acetyl-CoA isomerase